ncbi:MAG: peptide MFS transporter [Bacteroidota bacterium]
MSSSSKSVLGHPAGLFLLFFTEMWERFSFYGMRAILVFYLTSEIMGGKGWERADAMIVLAFYTGFVYLTPILGGYIADWKLGARKSVSIGAILMTLGHVSLALENDPTFYLGLLLLVLGNGFFKPNISAMVGQLYPDGSPMKDSGYTIFYMGINSGAFLGMTICGYLGETVSWSLGFGLAGIFMFFGLLLFWFGQNILGEIGLVPTTEVPKEAHTIPPSTIVPFTQQDRSLLLLSGLLLVLALILWFLLPISSIPLKSLLLLPFLGSIIAYIVLRLRKYPPIERDQLTVISIITLFSVFFWLAFEQTSGSMAIFARDYTDRSLTSESSLSIFRIIAIAITVLPMLILSGVLFKLSLSMGKQYLRSSLCAGLSFVTIWGIIIWMNVQNFQSDSLEVPASWFGSLGAFFIILLAPAFSSLWKRLAAKRWNPSGPIKFSIGFVLLGLGFVALVIGSWSIPQGAQTASVSMIWLVLAYFFHTTGELSLSPVGLSLVNKLSPKRLLGVMFGVWFIGTYIANFLAGLMGSLMDQVIDAYSLSTFFLLFVGSSGIAAILLVLLTPSLKRMMHGIN